jgi:hypothetical protein
MAHRFHIMLTDGQYEYLTRASERTSISVAELVRRAIDAKYPAGAAPSRREFTVAIWRRPTTSEGGRRGGLRLE